MNYKKQLFAQYRKQCILAYDAGIKPDSLKLSGNVTIDFNWTESEQTKDTFECMIIVYHNRPLVQRISNSDTFTTDTLYKLACEAEKYALANSNV
jgi:hypothetical protein